MWCLILIVLAGGLRTTTELESYATQRECAVELEVIVAQLRTAYPDDHDFTLVCRLKEAV